MDGNAAAGQLTDHVDGGKAGAVRFSVATAADDSALRRLLRENPMPGNISLSLEREPSYFAAAAIDGTEHRTIVAVENGRLVCCGSMSVRDRFINGRAMRIGYLGGLRLDAACRGRTSILLRGYEFFRKLHGQGGPAIYLTSIMGDNVPARRLLERGLSGMPTYRLIGEFVTLVIGRRRFRKDDSPRQSRSEMLDRGGALTPSPPYSGERAGVRGHFCERRNSTNHPSPQPSPPSTGERGPEVSRNFGMCADSSGHDGAAVQPTFLEFLNRKNRKFQFAPVWSAEDLLSLTRCPNLRPEDFCGIRSPDGELAACAALWDQRPIKQTIIRGYSSSLRCLRPAINLAATVLGRPRLPAKGQAISHGFVSHLAADPRRPELVRELISDMLSLAQRREIDYLTLGFDSRDPRLAILRKTYKPREIVSRLYAVHWDDGSELAAGLDDRLLGPDVALL